MLAVVNQPHAEGFRVEGLIPQGILDFIEKNYSKESVSIMEDDENLLDPHEQKWFREAEEADAPGKNMRMFRRFARLTQAQLAEKLGMSKQAISNMENGIRPISKQTAKELSSTFRVSVSNFI